jgi:teichuronic acid exporter
MILIGRFYDSADLGQFSRAATTKDGPQAALAGMFTRVAFPVFAADAHDPATLRQSLRRSIVAMMALNLPAMAGMGFLASLLVPVAFGPNWGPSIPLLQVLCIAGALWPMQLANVQALLAQGHSRLLFRTELFKKSLLIVVTVLTSLISIQAVAWGFVICGLAAHIVNAHYSGRLLAYGYAEQVKDILPYGGITLLMCIGMWLLAAGVEALNPLARLLVTAAAGGCLYVALVRLFGLEAWELVWSLFRVRPKTVARAA